MARRLVVQRQAAIHIMSKVKTVRCDVAEHLRTQEEMVAYLEACLEEADGEAALIVKALSDVARAKGKEGVCQGLLRITDRIPILNKSIILSRLAVHQIAG